MKEDFNPHSFVMVQQLFIDKIVLKSLILSDYEAAKNEVIFSIAESVPHDGAIEMITSIVSVLEENTYIKELFLDPSLVST